MLIRVRGPWTIYSAKTTTPTAVVVTLPSTASRLLISHKISGSPNTGGHVSVEIGDGTTFVAHHGAGTNIKSSNTTTSYSCLFDGVAKFARITLTIADGTHTVIGELLQ